MRNYEIMFIVKPTLEEEEIKKVASSFQSTLEKNGAKVTNVDAWGKLALINPNVIRHIVIRKED